MNNFNTRKLTADEVEFYALFGGVIIPHRVVDNIMESKGLKDCLQSLKIVLDENASEYKRSDALYQSFAWSHFTTACNGEDIGFHDWPMFGEHIRETSVFEKYTLLYNSLAILEAHLRLRCIPPTMGPGT